MSQNLFSSFHQSVKDRQQIFLRVPARGTFSFADAFDYSGRLANLFLAYGLEKGDRIAIQVEKSPEALFIYLASLRIGAVYVPLNPSYTTSELRHILGDAVPGMVICTPDKADGIREIFPKGVILTLSSDGDRGTLIEEAECQDEVFADADCAPDDLAAILYTSGTTGRSKGAMLTHENLRSNILALKTAWQFSPKDILLHALPIFHTHGLFVAINICLASSTTMLFLPKFDLDQIFDHLPGATCMMGVPTFYVRLLGDPRLTENLVKHMRLFISGSAPLHADTFAEFKRRTGHSVLERYGMTETNMNTSNPYAGERKPGTVGLPLQGIEVKIVGDDFQMLPAGAIGRILVRGPNVFLGYWQNPEKTQEDLLADGFFVTGDMGCFDGDGYLTIVGRSKDLVITGGLNVYPKEVEAEIDDIAAVRESAVFGLPHPDFGECVAAAVVPRNGELPTEASILEVLEKRLAKFKLPKRIVFVKELPRNVMGKVQKNALRETYKGLFD